MAKKYYKEDNEAIPAILYVEEGTQPVGFTDFSNDVVSIDLYGRHVRDYLFYRDDINNILFIKANPNYPTVDFSGFFTNMTADERKIMCKYILAPYALRLTQYTDEQDEENWFRLLRITQGLERPDKPFTGRALLIERMRRHVANYVRKELLTMVQTQQFYEDVFQLTEFYIRAATPKFKQWLYSTAPYDLTGFNSTSYWNQTLEDELIAIYEGLD